jgi:hypothetical protein
MRLKDIQIGDYFYNLDTLYRRVGNRTVLAINTKKTIMDANLDCTVTPTDAPKETPNNP